MKSNIPPVALITGSARRIGAIIAETLHQHGWNIIIHYRNSKTDAEHLCITLNQKRPSSAITIQSNLDHLSEIQNLVTQGFSAWQRIDALINNASEFFPTEVASTTIDQWDALINSNVKAPYFLAQQALPYLKAVQGCIINIADIHGLHPLKNYPVYSIAKAGLVMLTKTLARECAPEIRVNAIAPGPTLHPENINAISEERRDELIDKTLLKRLSNGQEVANAVLFLAQQLSMTGEILKLDSGRTLGSAETLRFPHSRE